jgi:Tol biopolymer transport system component
MKTALSRLALAVPAVLSWSCIFGPSHHVSKAEAMQGLTGPLRDSVDRSFATGQWDDALSVCEAVEAVRPDDCGARYCDFLARSMQAVDRMNDFLTPHSGLALIGLAFEAPKLDRAMDEADRSADTVIANRCEFDLPSMPVLVGNAADPLLRGEARGHWTVRDAHLLAAIFSSMRYVMKAAVESKKPPAPGPPELPPLLADMKRHLVAQDALLFAEPADPTALRGGWHDRNGNHVPDAADELLIDIFVPGTDKRVFDFSAAEFVRGESLPAAPLTPTASLPPARCGYQKFHFDDIAGGSEVSTTDGMSFSPDGAKVAVPLLVKGKSQIVLLGADGKSRTCVSCGQPGNNDGVRWRPGSPDTLLFISDRDHPYAIGNEGGGLGQELYAMKVDGSQVTRLTQSHAWATNYHANWSPDGKRIVWGSTESRTWDVMVADFVSDGAGMRLESPRRVVHDTTWWETHGFTPDGKRVITTNTRAGFMATDVYAVDLETGQRQRLTTPDAWDEHAHLSPDGRKLAWISGRFRPASVAQLSDGSISPVYDFLWIGPGILFDMIPPAGYSTELTLMDADGSNLERLTRDNQVVADNEWSADGRRIVFRQTNAWASGNPTKIRILTFDDCQ